MWISIAIGLGTALFVMLFGIANNNQVLLQLAGAIVALVSILSSYGMCLCRVRPKGAVELANERVINVVAILVAIEICYSIKA
jgi:hypothetical protein